MLNRWIKPNEDLQKVLDKAISDKWGYEKLGL